MDDLGIKVVLAAVAGVVIGLITFVLLFTGTYFTGTYSYEYRCTDNVVEKRLHIWGGVPIGGFESIDGDPVGTCGMREGDYGE